MGSSGRVDEGLERLAFAVGCFHFGFRPEVPYRGNIGDYVEKLREALNRVPNINQIRVELPEGGEWSIELDEEVEGRIEDGFVFPMTNSLRVEFELFVPFRIQADVFPWGQPEEAGTERFKVFIRHAYESPVCFVVPLDMASGADPASSIPVVREFLKREINNGSEITFGALGPSPLHANFYLQLQDTNTDRVSVDFKRSPGYATVIVSANPAAFDSIDDAFDFVRYAMTLEVDQFYGIKQVDGDWRIAWRKIERQLGELTKNMAGERIINRVAHMWSRSSMLAGLHQDLANLEASIIVGRHQIDSQVARIYGDSSITFIKPIIEHVLAEREKFPTEQIGRLVEFLEQRRSKAFELGVVLLAALVGGVAGSVATLATSG